MSSKNTKARTAKKSAAKSKVNTVERLDIGEPYEEKLPVTIPIEEVHAAGELLANVISEREAFKMRRKAENAKGREQNAYYDERIKDLGEQVKMRVRKDRVRVQDVLVHGKDGKHVVEIVRLDTDECVATREPTELELQQDLFDPKAPEKAAPKAGGLKSPGEAEAQADLPEFDREDGEE